MHSALPQVNGNLKKYGPKSKTGRVWRAVDRALPDEAWKRLVVIVLAVAVVVYLLKIILYGTEAEHTIVTATGKTLGGGGGILAWLGLAQSKYRGINTGAQTIQFTKSPYIYPDLAYLGDYRARKTIKVSNKFVTASTHSFIYNGDDAPEVILVVGLDDTYPKDHLDNVIEDRLAYAKRHGLGLYIRFLNDFAKSAGEPDIEFAKLQLLREAMFSFRDSKWVWWLDQDAIIMNPQSNIVEDLLEPSKLDKYMIRDAAVVPPESVIHTYKRVPASQIKLIISQNDRGISSHSFVLRNDDLYGRMLVSYWLDPLQQSYHGFQSFTGFNGQLDSSITHMVQWHPAVLSRMALVKQKYLGSRPNDGNVVKDQKFQFGDFVYMVRDTNEVVAAAPESVANEWEKMKDHRDRT
ncbi:probable alpha-1,6-mannosyltransferase Mnn11p [Trichomonascus vanleenenianus]|uniref:putative alpha-1,6-mannosyltransferase Mnn11p n=1 Tax=Trichomonascus vanleenenianus TaxID=2268995 RepID=UPI003ECA9345